MKALRKKYRRIVAALVGVIVVLFILLVAMLFYIESIKEPGVDEIDYENLEAPDTPFLEDEEVIIIDQGLPDEGELILPVEKLLFEYVRVINSCGPHFEGDCLLVRSGPGTTYPVVTRLRNDIVLKIGGKVEHDGLIWYKIVFDEWLLYPERVEGDWYVSADYVEILVDEGDSTIWDEEHEDIATTTKEIIVDRGEQKLYAYDGEELFMEIDISTGLALTPTPRGTFTIFKKTPSRYMQGPLPNLSDKQSYDLPGVPWNLYFTSDGAVIHGAYWHTSFGSRYSHGCVNLLPEHAEKLYKWAELGTRVIVKD